MVHSLFTNRTVLLLLFFLFLLTPSIFFTETKDPFLIKEPLAKFLILTSALLTLTSLAEKIIVRVKTQSPNIKEPFFHIARESGFRLPSLWLPITVWLFAILFSLKDAVHKSLVFEFFCWQLLLAVLYILISQMREEPDRKLIFHGVALASVIAGLYGALQHFGIDFIRWASDWGDRPSSTFGNPNFAAGWWAMTIPLFFFKFISEKKTTRWLYACLTILMMLNLYWGRTRGAWLAFILSTITGVFILSLLKRKITFTWAVTSLTFFLIFLALSLKRMEIFHIKNPSVIERYFKWATAWEMIKENPIFGVGAGNLKVHFALYQAKVREKPFFRERLSFRATSESNVHNEYFQIWAELGAFGLLAFLGIFFCCFHKFIKNFRELPENQQFFQIGIGTALLSFLFYSLTNFPLHIVPNASLLFLLLGFADHPTKNVLLPEKKRKPKTAVGMILKLLSFLIVLFLTKQWIFPPLKADYIRLQAEAAAAQNNFPETIALYERAIQIDFYHSERTAYELGECYRKTGKFHDAIKAYRISTALRNYGEIYNNIGNCYYLLGKRDEAISNWETAVHLGLPELNAQKQTENNIKLLK